MDDFKVCMNKIVILIKDLKIAETDKFDFWFYYEWIKPATKKEMRLDPDEHSVCINLKPGHTELLIRLKEPPKLFAKPPSFLMGPGTPTININFSKFGGLKKSDPVIKIESETTKVSSKTQQPEIIIEKEEIDPDVNKKPLFTKR